MRTHLKQSLFSKTRIIFIIILFILFNTTFFVFYFSSRLGEVMLTAAERELYEITSMIVVNNITREKLNHVALDEIIVVNLNPAGEVIDIDFRLDLAYEMLINLREDLDRAAFALKAGEVPPGTAVINDELIIKVPFYAYTNNLLLMSLGPSIPVQVNLLEVIRGEISTSVSDYGINTVLIRVFLNLYITQSIILPIGREIMNIDFEILIASRVIQGRVPNLFPGQFGSNSGMINLTN